MSGRRRVKNVAYDEDEWGYGEDDSDDYWDEEDPAGEDYRGRTASSYNSKKNDKASSRGAAQVRSTKEGRAVGTHSGRSTGVTTTQTPGIVRTGSTCSSGLPTPAGGTPGVKGGGSQRAGGAARQKHTSVCASSSSSSPVKLGGSASCPQSETKDSVPKDGLANPTVARISAPRSDEATPSPPDSCSSSSGNTGHSHAPEILKTTSTESGDARAVRDSLCLVVIGHVDAGKSTLVGQLLLATGAVGERAVQKMKKLSGEAGKSSFFLAWLCDEGEDERERGVTIDVSVRAVLTRNKRRRLVLVDAPGHREFVCSMLAGAALADVAVLVVDAPSFEVGFRGQTKEHLLIVRCLGIQNYVVALNKMDEVGWSKETFDTIVMRLRDYMTGPEMGCAASRIAFVPVSAFSGVNVVRNEAADERSVGQGGGNGAVVEDRSGRRGRRHSSKDQKKEENEMAEKTAEHLKALTTWWKGPCLLEALEDVELHKDGDLSRQRLAAEPLAAVVSDAWAPSMSSSDSHVSLKILRGKVRTGDTVIAMPENTPLVCRSLCTFGESCHVCVAGDYVERAVFAPAASRGSSDAPCEVGVGSVLCEKEHLLPALACFLSRVMVFQTELPLVQGRQLIAHIHMFTGPCTIKQVRGVVSKSGVLLENSRSQERGFTCAALGRGMIGLVEIETAERVCVQPRGEGGTGGDQSTSVLSRIILRDGGRTVAAGVILNAAK